jgi:hypothetical protein
VLVKRGILWCSIVALRTCSYNGLGLDEFVVYAASHNANAVADVTYEVCVVVKSLNVRDTKLVRFILDSPRFLVLWYVDFKVLKMVFGEAFVAYRNKRKCEWYGER